MKINLLMAWIWILLGFVSGAWLGTKFHHPDWLGGYASHQRRLYRLGHISFFGLGATNLLFALTASVCGDGPAVRWASIAFILGALTMPLACFIFAHRPRLHALFYLPVTALLCGAITTLFVLAKL